MAHQELGIAVIGDEDLVSGMRLAGVSRYHIVMDNADSGEDVRKAVLSFINDSNVGVIAIQEDYQPFVDEITAGLRREKRVLPVIVEVPSKRGTEQGDVALHYRTFIRRFVGFDVEL